MLHISYIDEMAGEMTENRLYVPFWDVINWVSLSPVGYVTGTQFLGITNRVSWNEFSFLHIREAANLLPERPHWFFGCGEGIFKWNKIYVARLLIYVLNIWFYLLHAKQLRTQIYEARTFVGYYTM